MVAMVTTYPTISVVIIWSGMTWTHPPIISWSATTLAKRQKELPNVKKNCQTPNGLQTQAIYYSCIVQFSSREVCLSSTGWFKLCLHQFSAPCIAMWQAACCWTTTRATVREYQMAWVWSIWQEGGCPLLGQILHTQAIWYSCWSLISCDGLVPCTLVPSWEDLGQVDLNWVLAVDQHTWSSTGHDPLP